jgi:hypothetical protein
MTANFAGDLPSPLRAITTRPLFTMRLNVLPLQILGDTSGVVRRVGVVSGGTFTGPRLSGEILEGGSDWQTLRNDGSTALDVRLVLKTHDGAMIGMHYLGRRHGPADVIARLENREEVDPASYYFRITPLFETSSKTYGWLNHITAIGTGHRPPEGPVYSVFEVL